MVEFYAYSNQWGMITSPQPNGFPRMFWIVIFLSFFTLFNPRDVRRSEEITFPTAPESIRALAVIEISVADIMWDRQGIEAGVWMVLTVGRA